MLKPNEWDNNDAKWSKSPYLSIGDTIIKTGRFSYWSLTQFTYTCEEQYTKWKAFNERLKCKYNMGIDMYFLNDDRTHVNYKEMVNFCDRHIRDGVINPAKLFNKHRNTARLTNHHSVSTRVCGLKLVQSTIRSKHFPIVEGYNDYDEVEEWAD